MLNRYSENVFNLTSFYLNPSSREHFFPNIFSEGAVAAAPLWIINTECHITLNLLPVYSYGHPLSPALSIDTKISPNH